MTSDRDHPSFQLLERQLENRNNHTASRLEVCNKITEPNRMDDITGNMFNFPQVSDQEEYSKSSKSNNSSENYISNNSQDSRTNVFQKSGDLNPARISIDQHHEDCQRLYLRCPTETYIKLIPLINTTTPTNYHELLAETLRQCLHHVSFDAFYNLLFNNCNENLDFPAPGNGKKIDNSRPSSYEKQALTLCFYILETFRHPFIPVGNFATGLVNNPLLSKVKFYEVQRMFLAEKFIIDSLIPNEAPTKVLYSLSRHSVLQGYYIFCERLSNTYRTVTQLKTTEQRIVVSLSQLGKIIKTVYPNLSTRRFGRRGESKYHYVGIEWNKAIVDDDFACQIENQIQSQRKAIKDVPDQCFKASNLSGALSYKSSSYSYVNGSSKYPNTSCFPRTWQFIPGTIPQQSQWANEIMLKSADTLKDFNIHLERFILNFNDVILSSENICTGFHQIMILLGQRTTPDEAYLHLYLVVLLLAFPLCLASEKEVSREKQAILRENLKNFTSHLRTYLGSLRVGNLNHFLNFTNLLKKMIHLTQLTLSNFKTTLVKKTIKEFYHDLNQPPVIPQDSLGINTTIDEMIFKSVFVAIKAVYFESFGEYLATKISPKDHLITQLAKDFIKCRQFVVESIKDIPQDMTDEDKSYQFYDLTFQIFKIQLKVVHNIWLSQPSILELTVRAINYIILSMLKDMQCVSFGGLGRREHEVSKETFKLWWVCSAVLQEYMSILSEIVALSDMLSD